MLFPWMKHNNLNWHQTIAQFMMSRRALWLLLAIMTGFVLITHQAVPMLDRDEARFSQASRQMAETGDVITIRFLDELRAKKPAGIYWLQASSAALFGIDDVASYRLPSLIGFLATLTLTYFFTQSLFPSPAAPLHGVLAGLMLASGPLLQAEALLAKTDSLLLATILCQQIMLWRIYRDSDLKSPASHWGAFWIALSASILLKGPIGPLVSFVTIAGLCALDRNISWLKRLCWGRGLLIVGFITLPWALAVTIATDGAFLKTAISADFLAKVQSGQESHGAPFGTYFLLMFLMFFPASAFLCFVPLLGKSLLTDKASKFCLVWLVGYWFVIECVPTKLPHYILPLLPALALLTSLALTRSLPIAGWKLARLIDAGYIVAALSGTLLCGVLFWVAIKYGGITGGRAFVSVLLIFMLAALILWHLWLWRAGRKIGDLVVILCAGAVLHFMAIGGVIAHLDSVHIAPHISRSIDQLEKKPSLIALAGYHEPSAVFEIGRDVLLLTADEAALFLAEAKDALVIIEERALPDFQKIADELALRLQEVVRVDGFNHSRGQDVSLRFFQVIR